MSSPHLLLKYTESELTTLTDASVAKRHQELLAQIRAVAERDSAAKIEALNHAFEELSTASKRQAYIKKLEESLVVQVDVQGSRVALKEEGVNTPRLIAGYNAFVATHYPTKTALYQPKALSFNTFESFKSSQYYDQTKHTPQNFPQKVIVLRFDTIKDAVKFLEQMQAQKIVSQKLVEDFKSNAAKKGLMSDQSESATHSAHSLGRRR